MIDYLRHLRLAVSDAGRRAGLKTAAVALMAVAGGFLVAALWTFCARNLDLGPLGASLIVAALFFGGAVVLWIMGSKVRHPAPTTEDLRREVEVRASLAADAALDMAKARAVDMVDYADGKVHSLMDRGQHKIQSFASSAEERVLGVAEEAAQSLSRKADAGLSAAQEVVGAVRQVRAAPGAALLALGVLAFVVARRRSDRDDLY